MIIMRTTLPMPGPVGGPCLEKDSYILAESVEREATEAQHYTFGSLLHSDFSFLPEPPLERHSALDPAPSIEAIGLLLVGHPGRYGSRAVESDLVIGVDLGGTKILGGVVDRRGSIGATKEIATPTESQEAVLSAIESVIQPTKRAL